MSSNQSSHERSSSPSWLGRDTDQRPAGTAAGGLAGVLRRRRIPAVAVGVLMVLVCTTAAVVLVSRAGHREPVLTLARPVTVGHVLAPGDLREVPVAADPGVATIPAAEKPRVIGRPVAYALPAGTVLSPATLGRPRIPARGQAVVAVATEPGRVPPGITEGTHVDVLTTEEAATTTTSTPPAPGTSRSAGRWPAVVTGTDPAPNGSSTVVSLVLAVDDARDVAAAPADQLALVTVSPEGN